MKTGGGDFSPEAYEQLRDAYGKELQRQVDDEVRGTQLMGQEYGLETAPVDSPWADKIELWEYPDGKRDREDEKQSPNEILQIMRDAAQERIDAQTEVPESESEDEEADDLETMTDEEFEAHVDKLLEDLDEDEDEEETEEEEPEEEDDTEVEEEPEEEPETDSEPEPEPEEDEEEEVEPEEDPYDAEDVAAQIAELRAELDNMQFVTEQNDEPE